jgi:hypothetical protein
MNTNLDQQCHAIKGCHQWHRTLTRLLTIITEQRVPNCLADVRDRVTK